MNEQLVANGIIEAAGADRVRTRIDTRHLKIWGQAKSFGKCPDPGAPDIVVRDDVDRCRGVRQWLRIARYGGNLDLGEFFEG